MGRDTTVLVIGGGSTGCGIVRDLARRGVNTTLVERGTLTEGTTGRMHGLLHSGARYADTDPTSAQDCIQENTILREIAAHCVESTGGLFVETLEDPDEYFQPKLEACNRCSIPAEAVSGDEARSLEPHLSEGIERAIRVPDAAIDPFRLCVANAIDAENHGATIHTHTRIVDIIRKDDTVVGVEIQPTGADSSYESGGRKRITAEYVVNATGAWAGQIAAMADLDVTVRPSKGAMTIMNTRQIDTVINRCRPKGDADIIVPHETTAILGTTDVEVDDPDEYAEEKWEVDLLIEELAELVPILADARTIRSFWGVRPLYEPPEANSGSSGDITRDFFILDHAQRDAVDGFVSIVGGKFTTYRLMAERVADLVCDRLGTRTECDTDAVALPGSEESAVLDRGLERFDLRSPIARRSADRLGSRAPEVLESDSPNPVVCDCEGVTRAEIQDAIDQCGADLNGVRIRTRATMGNCQGGLCCVPMTAELHPEYSADRSRRALEELYAERWKGQRHALWGEQLSQVMVNHFLHATTFNRDRSQETTASIDWKRYDMGPDGLRDQAGASEPEP